MYPRYLHGSLMSRWNQRSNPRPGIFLITRTSLPHPLLPFVPLICGHQLPCRLGRDCDEEGWGIKGRGEARAAQDKD